MHDLSAASDGRVSLSITDITQEGAVKAWVGQVTDQLDEAGFDVLVSNAGILTPGPMEILPLQAIKREFEVNVFGGLAVINAVHETDTIGDKHMPQIARFAEYGDPDVLRVIDMPAPTAGQGQVRVAVRAAGVNPFDWKTVQGLMRDEIQLVLPAGVGSDVSGLVDQVGPGVSEFVVGDEVLSNSVTPSFAEYALAEQRVWSASLTKSLGR